MQEELLAQLLTEREIRNVLLRYCRGVDRGDRELLASCFHEDAKDDHGNWVGSGARDIVERILAAVMAPSAGRPMHFLGNVLVEVVSKEAFCESYVLALRGFVRDGKPATRTRAVRFVDRFTLRDGAWRISERVVVDDWNRVDEVVEQQVGSDLFRYSSKDKDDPVYAIRNGRVAR